MKKIHILLLAAVMLLSFTGCGSPEPVSQPEAFTFTYNGIQITPGAEAAPIIDALGKPKSCTEEPSCAFEGMDKTYYYGSFYLSTCPMDGKDHVYRIWLADDSVATEDGIRIGTAQAQAEAVYGADHFNGTNSYSQVLGNSRLTILVEDGAVSSIQYELIIE